MKDPMEILARVLEGEASDGELKELIGMLNEDEALRQRARALAEVHGQLGVVMEGELASIRRQEAVMEVIRKADGAAFADQVTRRLRTERWGWRSLAAAAVLMLAGIGVWQMNRGEPLKKEEPMATLQRVENLDWGMVDDFEVGEQFQAGATLNFRSGLLELELNGRGRMVVEGPAHLEFPEPGLALLKYGRIVMRATKAGHGYRVETSQGSIVDLGTEFGVSVGADGRVETHVLEGQVEAVGQDGQRVTLNKDDALALGPDGGSRIEADGGQFYTQLPPERSDESNFVHWPLDDLSGNMARARTEGLGQGNADMVSHALGESHGPETVEGVFGAGLGLDGIGAFTESGFRGIGGGKARTVCFWVRVPEKFSKRQGFGIVSWGHSRPEGHGEVWQISVNPLSEEGPMGRLRVGLHGGQVIGSTDLRDGAWHHVAVVLYGGSQSNVGTHVLMYVDGGLEGVSRRALREVNTRIETADHGVWLGRNITHRTSTFSPAHPHGGFFRGALDEVYIFDAALNQSEVMELMTTNEIPK
ncbi:LamG-like jellyroll fold domain-containing protein [Haloferula sp.]|uniref:LamG-like jellyroll fold domain-containing protein n=1 Tax=Haloferula sp. TaxID=2497595 RepID=UPI00329CD4C1